MLDSLDVPGMTDHRGRGPGAQRRFRRRVPGAARLNLALRRLAIADAFARLPQGMVSLTVLLVAAEHASMAVAGLVVAGYTLGQAVTGPVRGRLADRYGLTKVAPPAAAWATRWPCWPCWRAP